MQPQLLGLDPDRKSLSRAFKSSQWSFQFSHLIFQIFNLHRNLIESYSTCSEHHNFTLTPLWMPTRSTRLWSAMTWPPQSACERIVKLILFKTIHKKRSANVNKTHQANVFANILMVASLVTFLARPSFILFPAPLTAQILLKTINWQFIFGRMVLSFRRSGIRVGRWGYHQQKILMHGKNAHLLYSAGLFSSWTSFAFSAMADSHLTMEFPIENDTTRRGPEISSHTHLAPIEEWNGKKN